MLIFFKARIVLFAVEKTATTSLQDALLHLADLKFINVDVTLEKHMGYLDYKTHVEPVVREQVDRPMDLVGVIREPVSWVHSWYRYRHRIEDAGTPRSTRGIEFEQFVRDCCLEPWEQPPHAWITSQSKRVCDSDGKVGLTRLYRYEDLPRLVRFLERRLGQELRVPRENISPGPAKARLSDKTLEMFRASFARDFEIYEALSQLAMA